MNDVAPISVNVFKWKLSWSNMYIHLSHSVSPREDWFLLHILDICTWFCLFFNFRHFHVILFGKSSEVHAKLDTWEDEMMEWMPQKLNCHLNRNTVFCSVSLFSLKPYFSNKVGLRGGGGGGGERRICYFEHFVFYGGISISLILDFSKPPISRTKNRFSWI